MDPEHGMPASELQVKAAYAHCLAISRDHYENFPVASMLLPQRLRHPVAAIYAFARRADDFADEGDIDNDTRIKSLQAMGTSLDAIINREATDDPVFIAVNDAIVRFQLPIELFHELLSAFTQDVTKHRYAHFGEVMEYCKRSANPVGRLLLHLTNQATKQNIAYSDGVCSALQLINFYQDLAQDYHEQGRIYIPADEMMDYGVSESHFRDTISDSAMAALMQKQYQRADKILRAGAPLGKQLKGRFGIEIRAVILGGARVLYRLRQQDKIFSRPRLNYQDWFSILKGAFLKK